MLSESSPHTAAGEPKVLLVDDSELSLAFAQAVLEESRFEVRTAQTVTDAENVLRQWLPDLVLVDVTMPGTSGPELCRLLKSRMRTRAVPVLLFSAFEERVLEKMARTCGADGFVSKVGGVGDLALRLAAFQRRV